MRLETESSKKYGSTLKKRILNHSTVKRASEYSGTPVVVSPCKTALKTPGLVPAGKLILDLPVASRITVGSQNKVELYSFFGVLAKSPNTGL